MRSKKQGQAKAIQDEKRVHERMLFFLCGFDFVLSEQLQTQIALDPTARHHP